VLLFGSAVGYIAGHSAVQTNKIISVVSDRTQKLCDFFGSIGTAPVQANSSKLGVEIVEYSREAYSGLQCPVPLTPAPAGLNNLARKYNVIVVK
jgi:hypothetical protein